jgi:cysteinyl-tRNA synthetase
MSAQTGGGLATVTVYDSFLARKVAVEPQVPGQLSMYVCGPTVYNYFHIGNARPLVAFDVVARHLRARGYQVKFVRNITDVDDKIIQRAREVGEEPTAFAERWTAEYHRDYAALRCLPPDIEPRATQHIHEMHTQIEQLIARDMAYAVDGSVYFAVSHFAGYGELSKLPREELLEGARKELEPGKREPADFALWKATKPGEPAWDSPWGKGRPGWHIECSAMAEKYLGTAFDLHGGGIDLKFPHHENERAQAQGIHGCTSFAKYWIHNGFVGFRWVYGEKVLAQGSKISKSDERMRPLYQAFVARTCIERHGGEAVRLWLLTTHYRNPITFDIDVPPIGFALGTEPLDLDAAPCDGSDPTGSKSSGTLDESKLRLPGLEEAERRLEYAYLSMQRLGDALAGQAPLTTADAGAVAPDADGWLERLYQALDDDFNTPVALAEWTAALAFVNRLLDGKLTPALAKDVRRRTLWRLQSDLLLAGQVLGICERSPAEYLAEHRVRRVTAKGLDQARIDELLTERAQARQQKDFASSDLLRTALLDLGVEVMDTPQGMRWRVRD